MSKDSSCPVFVSVDEELFDSLGNENARLHQEVERLRAANAELRFEAKHYFDAMMDIIHGRQMYPRRSC